MSNPLKENSVKSTVKGNTGLTKAAPPPAPPKLPKNVINFIIKYESKNR